MDGLKPSVYRIGFYALAATVTLLLSIAAITYYAFDRDSSYIFGRIIDATLSEPARLDSIVFLPEYYYDDRDILVHTYAKHVNTIEDFDAWKKGPVLEELRKRPTIHQVPHNYTMVSSEPREGYTMSRFTMKTFYPDDIIFYKLTPTAGTPDKSSSVLVIPGSGHQGVRDLLGEPSALSKYYYQDEMAKRLVLEGYDVYTIELHGYGEREFDVGSACDNASSLERLTFCSAKKLNGSLVPYGIKLATIQTDEITQVLAHMVYDDGATDIAVVGLSLGAAHAVRQAIINSDVVDVAVVASGVRSLANGPISYDGTLGKLLCCDSIDAVATLAPKPIYVSFGRNEGGITGWEASTNYTGNFLKSVYEMHGAADNFYYYVHDGIHEYHTESVIEFIGMHIGN